MKVLINQSILLFFILFTLINYSQEVSTVYIARNNGFAGSGAPAHMFADYEYLGKLKNKNYIIYKTNKAKLKIGLMSNFGLKRSIEVNLNPGYPTYVNVNLSKVYVLKSVNNDEKLKRKVIKRVNSEELLNVTLDEKRENLSKYRKRLSKVYEEDLALSDDEIINQIIAHNDNVKALLNNTSGNSLAENTGQKNEREKLEDAIDMAIAKEKVLQKENSTASITSDKVEQNTIDSISVSEIYNNYLAYIDPNNQITSIQSITKIESSATLTIANGSEMKNNFVNLNLRTREGKVVGIMKMPSMNSKTVFDGTGGYTELNNGYKTKLTPQVIKTFKKNSQFYFTEQKAPENSEVSVKKFENNEVYSVKYSLIQNGQPTTIEDYYDTQTFAKVASKNASTVNGFKTSSITLFKNYKDFNGIKRPTLITSQISNKGTNVDTKINSQSTVDYSFNESFEKYANQPLDDVAGNLAAIPTTSIDAGSPIGQTNSSASSSPVITAETEDDLINSEAFKNLNKREQAYQLMLVKQKEAGSSSTSGFSTNTAPTVESTGERERISKMDAANAGKLKYRRSSLYTLMVDDNTREYYNVIKDAFGNTELSEKFNNHNIGPYLIPAHGMSGEKDQTLLIEDYLNANGVARNLVARWFNRDENGHFDMNLIAKRGQYNASEIDLKVAQSSMRGKALLSDAGRELIRNTFVIVYDYKYTNKQKQAKKRKGILNAVTTVASFVPGGEDVANISTLATAASDVVGKGYFVRTTSYLYRLVWNDEIAKEFYDNLWIDENSDDKSKKEAFENSNLFKLEYVGSEISRNNLQSTIFSSKSNEQLIDIATTKAVDKNIGKLQRSYEQFRVKTPLLSAEPIAAKIGLKEGLEKGDKFEVLEQVLNEDGTTEYERVTTIKVDKNHIWDNTYLADEAGAETSKPYTIFKGRNNKVAPGMLIRQLK
ncbi:hypothetical protein [Mesohalobacter halotolerans]|uniref:Uncharacterized protein n=1 Tax=Mesohalobacter halotolerans TaxID=1883405 RepID=A0A4U5TTH1_9FLAO|nr:hypothetical protein [Mesohalobacter halotolerans]MBS3738249.1 hypothetical protein [Psychroflexus sp.]TKS57433.1 hypothetical protein FCN74_03160 [Mesohalobacter halotolerans]